MKKLVIVLLILVLLVLFFWYLSRKNNKLALSTPPIWRSDFTSVNWLNTWNCQGTGTFGLENASIINDSSRGQVLNIFYPKGSSSPASHRNFGTPLGGSQWLGTITPRDSVYLRYYFKFDSNFKFVKGGKFPGLYGGTEISGGENPDGTNGFSTRFMWRSGGAGEVYAYLPSSADYGSSLGRGSWVFTVDKWHCIEQHVSLNTPGSNNGVVRVWLNGKKVYEKTNLVYRTVNTLKIEGVFFSTFFGGDDPSWATPVNTNVKFSDFILSSTYIGL